MTLDIPEQYSKPKFTGATAVLVVLIMCAPFCLAQTISGPMASAVDDVQPKSVANFPATRMERIEVAGGSELLTIFARSKSARPDETSEADIPLVSILRDTLGDTDPENDRLRYVWMLTYAKPSARQRFAAAIPFFYGHMGNKSVNRNAPPPPIIDLGASDKQVWERFFWIAVQRLLLDTYGMPVKAATRTYRQNLTDYRKAHVVQALAALSLYQGTHDGAPLLTNTEMTALKAKLVLSDKTLGGIVDDLMFNRVANEHTALLNDLRGHNWELLRQYSEAQGLYFEPLQLADGSATHALVWIAKSDLATNNGRTFDSRFLNITDPWSDKRLASWSGYTEQWYFNPDNSIVSAETPGSRRVEMIPLALYGLDNPKIPMLLVDFRDRYNPKRRELSRRVLEDVTKNILSISQFSSLPYFAGRFVFDFVTGRRGMDVNQPSRLKTYAQLKLLLSLDQTLDTQLRDEISERLESVSVNPLDNDAETEQVLALQQYKALRDWASQPDGLAARITLDRREELVKSKHGSAARTWFTIANLLTLGAYTRREPDAPQLLSAVDQMRRFDFHARFLREVAQAPRIEVVWPLERVRSSLDYMSQHGRGADGKTINAIAQIFARTMDQRVRASCISSLMEIDSPKAKRELVGIYHSNEVDEKLRGLMAAYLKEPAVGEKQSGDTIKPALELTAQ